MGTKKATCCCGLERKTGLEPATYSLEGCRSTKWATSADKKIVGEEGFEPPKTSSTDLQSAPFGHSGTLPTKKRAGGRIRTADRLITNQLLWPTELHRLFCFELCKELYLVRGMQKYHFFRYHRNFFHFFYYFFIRLKIRCLEIYERVFNQN